MIPLVAKSYIQAPKPLTFLTRFLEQVRKITQARGRVKLSHNKHSQARGQEREHQRNLFPTGKGKLVDWRPTARRRRRRTATSSSASIFWIFKGYSQSQKVVLAERGKVALTRRLSVHFSLGKTPQTCTHWEHMPQTERLESQQWFRPSVDHRIKSTHLQ